MTAPSTFETVKCELEALGLEDAVPGLRTEKLAALWLLSQFPEGTSKALTHTILDLKVRLCHYAAEHVDSRSTFYKEHTTHESRLEYCFARLHVSQDSVPLVSDRYIKAVAVTGGAFGGAAAGLAGGLALEKRLSEVTETLKAQLQRTETLLTHQPDGITLLVEGHLARMKAKAAQAACDTAGEQLKAAVSQKERALAVLKLRPSEATLGYYFHASDALLSAEQKMAHSQHNVAKVAIESEAAAAASSEKAHLCAEREHLTRSVKKVEGALKFSPKYPVAAACAIGGAYIFDKVTEYLQEKKS